MVKLYLVLNCWALLLFMQIEGVVVEAEDVVEASRFLMPALKEDILYTTRKRQHSTQVGSDLSKKWV